jgi:sterol 3beta-glucosyltransferase
MKITILAYGSRGDIEPFIALVDRLIENGHEVTLALPQRFSSLLENLHVTRALLPGDPQELSIAFNRAGTNPIAMVQAMREHIEPIAIQVARLAWEACQETDLIVHTFAFTTGGHVIARKLRVPDISVQLFPVFAATGDFPYPAFPPLPFGKLYNYFSHKIGEFIFELANRISFTRIKGLLPELDGKVEWPFYSFAGHPPTPLLFAISPTVIPVAPEWGSHVHITGYWFSRKNQDVPDPILRDFVVSGSPPICVGFGSMIHPHANQIQEKILKGLHSIKQRAVILTGWENWENHETTQDFYFTKDAPHSWLFPKCKLIIHHGGAGTTASALRAGVSNIIIPFAVDQPFWARQVYRIGAGPAPLYLSKLSIDNFTTVVNHTLRNEQIIEQARVIAEKIQVEDGIGAAVQMIENIRQEFA